MFYRVIIAVALSLGIAGAAQAQAVNITPLMENECQWDYHNFCGQYAIGSELLDLCRSRGHRASVQFRLEDALRSRFVRQ